MLLGIWDLNLISKERISIIMKIAAVCSNGLGSSFMLEMNIKEALKNLSVEDVEVTHFDLSSAMEGAADHFIVSKDLANNLKIAGDEMTVLDSIVDKKELEEKLKLFLETKGIYDEE